MTLRRMGRLARWGTSVAPSASTSGLFALLLSVGAAAALPGTALAQAQGSANPGAPPASPPPPPPLPPPAPGAVPAPAAPPQGPPPGPVTPAPNAAPEAVPAAPTSPPPAVAQVAPAPSDQPGGQFPPPGAPPPAGPKQATPPPEAGVHEHDGLYFRAGIGGGLLLANTQSDNSAAYGGATKGSFSGPSFGLELSLGGTPAPGLVIGGGIFLSAASVKQEVKVNGRVVEGLPLQAASLFLLGPFIDYYVDPHDGWHVQGALGLAGVAVQKKNDSETDPRVQRRDAGGFGVMVGGGYDFWVGSQWSLGGLLRVMYATTETQNRTDEHFMNQAYAVPELLFTGTFH